jgi:phosphatidate phosphatase APP1
MNESDIQISLLARLRRRFQDGRPALLVPYRGFGTPAQVTLRGRALRDPGLPPPEAGAGAWANLLAAFERLESDELNDVAVRGQLGDLVLETRSDDEGYFELSFAPATPLAPGWHAVHLAADAAGAAPALGAVLVPPSGALGVISDIDDTIVETGATSPLKLARLLLLENARTRTVFPGVAAFYRALHAGPDGQAGTPIFYLSGSPWNLYDLLTDLFTFQGIPDGPLLLRGLQREVILPALRGRSSLREHKCRQIERVLATYPERRFVLVGDSGQLDPEIYQQVLADFPGRVAAIYIRDVADDRRDTQVRALAAELAAQGGALLYAADTLLFAEDAAARGLIAPSAVEAVRSAAGDGQ